MEYKIKKALEDKFEGATVEIEYGGPMRFYIDIVSEEFYGQTEEERQDLVWGYLNELFKYPQLKFVGSILTWTPSELEAYEKESSK